MPPKITFKCTRIRMCDWSVCRHVNKESCISSDSLHLAILTILRSPLPAYVICIIAQEITAIQSHNLMDMLNLP